MNTYIHGNGNIAHKIELTRPQSLSMVRCHFLREAGGASAKSANLVLSLDSWMSRDTGTLRFNQTLWTWTAVGVDASSNSLDVDFYVQPQFRDWFSFEPMDVLNFAWTNPDSPNVAWGLVVRLDG